MRVCVCVWYLSSLVTSVCCVCERESTVCVCERERVQCVWVCLCVCVCTREELCTYSLITGAENYTKLMCLCRCVCERERERERESGVVGKWREREKERGRERGIEKLK